MNLAPEYLISVGILVVFTIWYLLIGRYWLKALLSGIRMTPVEIVLMRLRDTPVNLIITGLIKAAKGVVIVSRDSLEACHLAGGDVTNVVDGLIYAKAQKIELDIKTAMQWDLQRHNIINHLMNR
jgi:uncharacterized protein YqfA (UPF0365 family)